MRRLLGTLVALVATLAAGVAASTLTLTSSNVDTALLKSSKPTLVAFTAKWCGHCVQAKPKLYAASADPFVQARASIALVDCEDDKPLCEAFSVSGYPTISLIPAATGSLPNAKSAAVAFRGPRSTAGFRDFLLRMTRKDPLVFLRPGSNALAYPADTFEGEYARTDSPNFSVERLISGLGRDGVAFLLVVPSSAATGGGDDDGLLSSEKAVDYSSAKKARQSGAHPFVISTIAAAEGALKSELTVLAVTADVVRSTPALSQALQPLLLSAGVKGVDAAVSGLKEPLLLQLQSNEKRVEVARVACEGGKSSPSQGSFNDPLLGIEVIATVPCDPATGTPLSSSPKADELTATVQRWLKTQRFPAVTELTPDSYPYLANNEGTYLAVAVVNETEIKEYNKKLAANGGSPSRPGKPVLMPPKSVLFMTSFSKLASRASTTLPQNVRSKFLFGWLDGELHHEHFLSQFNVSPSLGPTLLVIDIPTKRYWLDEGVKEYEEMEAQMEDIYSGKAPVFRQGMLAVPQKLVNTIGLVPSALVGIVVVGAIGYLLWKLVLAELLGFNDGTKASGYGSTMALDAEAAAEEASKARQQERKEKKAPGPAVYRGASPSRNTAAPQPQKRQQVDEDEDSDVDDDGHAFQKVDQHDDNVDGSDSEDEGDAAARRKKGSNLRQRKKPAQGSGEAEEDEEEEKEMTASARAAMNRRLASRRRVDG